MAKKSSSKSSGPYQSARTGKFVTKKYAMANPDKTFGHRPKKGK